MGMKKHQLLEKAMRDYPAGTKFKSKTIDKVFESTGSFYFDDTSKIRCLGNDHIVYSQYGWAEPVKPSILDGKVAIQVNNEREFELIKTYCNLNLNPPLRYPLFYRIDLKSGYYSANCKVIPFADFAAEVGLPKFIMKSEDGVDLHAGDQAVLVSLEYSGKYSVVSTITLTEKTGVKLVPADNTFVFSTREAAEKWIEEQNRPKMAHAKLFDKSYRAVATDGHIDVYCNDSFVIRMMPSDLEDMLHAYKSLQQ